MSIVWAEHFDGAVDEQDLEVYDATWAVTRTGSPAATVKIDQASYYAGTAALRLVTTANPSIGSATHTFTGQTSNTIYWAQLSSSTTNLNYCSVYSMNYAGGKYATGIRMHIGKIYCMTPGAFTEYGSGYTINTWYYFKMTFNTSTKTYSAWVKGGTQYTDWTLLCTNVGFFNQSTWGTIQVTGVLASCQNNAATGFTQRVDEIQVGEADALALLKMDGTTWADATDAATKVDGGVFT